MPWKRPLEPPAVANIFPQVRANDPGGNNSQAVALAIQHMSDGAIKQDTEPHLTVPAFLMQLEFPKAAEGKDYLRTVISRTATSRSPWSDEHGDRVRRTLSRPDNLVVQWIAAPAGQP